MDFTAMTAWGGAIAPNQDLIPDAKAWDDDEVDDITIPRLRVRVRKKSEKKEREPRGRYVHKNTLRGRVYLFLKDNPRATFPQIMEAVPSDTDSLRGALNGLMRSQYILSKRIFFAGGIGPRVVYLVNDNPDTKEKGKRGGFDMHQSMIALIKKKGNPTSHVIMGHFGISRSYLYSILAKLRAQGLIDSSVGTQKDKRLVTVVYTGKDAVLSEVLG